MALPFVRQITNGQQGILIQNNYNTLFLSNIVKKTSYIVYNMEIISKCADYI